MARLGNFDVELNFQGWFDIDMADPLNGWLDKVAVGVGTSTSPPPPTPTAPLLGGGGGGGRWPYEPARPWPVQIDLFDFEPSQEPLSEPFEGPEPTKGPDAPDVEKLFEMFEPGEFKQKGVAGVSIQSPEAWCVPDLLPAPPMPSRRDWFPLAMAFLGLTTAVGVGIVIGRVTQDASEKEPDIHVMLAELRRKGLI
jgi:hypothetical protein